MIRSIEWLGDRVRFIDQTALPLRETYVETSDINQIAEAIRTLSIRGAPLIGIAAAYGIALAASSYAGKDPAAFADFLQRAMRLLSSTRPTAVNLAWALDRLKTTIGPELTVGEIKQRLITEACAIHREDAEMCTRIGEHGAALVPKDATVLTHCNTGALATGGEGTALSVITTAHRAGKKIHVIVDETRPLFQGARLTAWELKREGIPVTLVTDSTAAVMMRSGKIDFVITGADRIAGNGDTANKIGTYGLAVSARHHQIPMYIAAPGSTIDPMKSSGEAIPIEERTPEEITTIAGWRIAPEGIGVYSPAFDVTPGALISAIITEQGVHRPPYAFRVGAARAETHHA